MCLCVYSVGVLVTLKCSSCIICYVKSLSGCPSVILPLIVHKQYSRLCSYIYFFLYC